MRRSLQVEGLEGRQMLAADVAALAGDVNFDGQFTSSDLVAMFQAGRYETDTAATWAEGDFDFDGKFGSSDLVVAFQEGLYENGAVAAEPGEEETPSPWAERLQAHVDRLQAAIDSGNLPVNINPEEATTLLVAMQAAIESGDFGPLQDLRESILGDGEREHEGRPDFDVDIDQIRERLRERWSNIDEVVGSFQERFDEWRSEWRERFEGWQSRFDDFASRWGNGADDAGEDAGDDSVA